MTPPRPFVIVGAGALGQAYAVGLASAGLEVALVPSERGRRALAHAGEIVVEGMLTRRVKTASDVRPGAIAILAPGSIQHAEGIVFATKGYDLLAAARSLAGVQSDWVLGVQNGVAKDDILAEVFGPDRVLGEAGNLASERTPQGAASVSNLGTTYVGELAAASSDRAARVVAALSAGGIPAEVAADIKSVQWSKAVQVAGSFAVVLMTRANWSQAMEDPDLTRAFLALARETAGIAEAAGVRIADYPGFPALSYVSQPEEQTIAGRVERVRQMRAKGGELDRRSSILQDLLAGRHLEVEFIFGDLVERARRVGKAVPRLELIRDLARGLNRISQTADASPAPALGA